jgi:hypothetical protein
MKNLLLLLILSTFVCISGCKKESTPSGPDLTTPWVGNYSTGGTDGLTQIQITKASNTSVKVVFKVVQFYYEYTACTLQNVNISGNTATISEIQNIIEQTNYGPYRFNGMIELRGNTLALTTSAVSVQVPSNENSPMAFNFQGAKVQ